MLVSEATAGKTSREGFSRARVQALLESHTRACASAPLLRHQYPYGEWFQ